MKTYIIENKVDIYTYQINGFILHVVESVAFNGGSRHSDAGKKESEEDEEKAKKDWDSYEEKMKVEK